MSRDVRGVLAWGMVLVLAGVVCGGCPWGDFDGDCKVDMFDLAELGRWWLSDECEDPNCTADIDGDWNVSLYELEWLAENWLKDLNRTVYIKWFGHATLKIWIDGYKVYVDPDGLSVSPHDADLVLVTHTHGDHYSPSDIAKVWKAGTTVLAGPGDVVNSYGQGVAMGPGETMEFGEAMVTTVPAYNIVKTNHPKSRGWVGFIIEFGLVSVYAAGDTERIPEMKGLGDITVAFLPIDGTYTMSASEAALAAGDIAPEVAIPYHIRSASPQVFANQAPCDVKIMSVLEVINSEDWLGD